MSGTADGSALISALQKIAGESLEQYREAKKRSSNASKEARVRKAECKAAKRTWQRCSAAVEGASRTLAECNMVPIVDEEREKYIGGDAQDHGGEEREEYLTQKIDATDDEEEEENWHEDEEGILAARSCTPPQRSTPDPERPSAIALTPALTLTRAQQDKFRARYPHGIPQTPGSTPPDIPRPPWRTLHSLEAHGIIG